VPQPRNHRVGGHLQAVPESRRRPRREDVVTYRVRVELTGAEPPVWRRLDIASNLFLDRVHHVLQVVMGWDDYHLHQFASGDEVHRPHAENYVMPSAFDEDAVGVDERRVRLDEVLVEPGERLHYEYDFGDSWSHTLDLEAELDRAPDDPAHCLDGARACPPEDCGGIGGYAELLRVLAHPDDPEYDHMRTWAGQDFDPGRFDGEAVNGALSVVGGLRAPAIDPDSPLGELLARAHMPSSIGEALDALAASPPSVDAAEPETFGAHYRWLLNRIGDEGVKLTAAGYLPPALVSETVDALELNDHWNASTNREHHIPEVLHFRESAQHLGLLRKANGRLLLTKAGTRARTHPDLLWRHMVTVLPVATTSRGPEAECGRQAGTLFLLAVAAGLPKQARAELVREGLSAAGWRDGGGDALSDRSAYHMMWGTSIVLEYLQLLPRRLTWPEPPETPVSAKAITLARAALGL
jgi:hypothetical protein